MEEEDYPGRIKGGRDTTLAMQGEPPGSTFHKAPDDVVKGLRLLLSQGHLRLWSELQCFYGNLRNSQLSAVPHSFQKASSLDWPFS